jgi:hypothetical protein
MINIIAYNLQEVESVVFEERSMVGTVVEYLVEGKRKDI